MRPIVVIAPESDSYQMVQRIAAELGIQKNIRLHLTGLSRSLSAARQAEAEGAHVIVVRGWSANQIVEAGIKTPVVFLPISMQDIVHVLTQAQSKAQSDNPRIGFIVYPQLQTELAAISSLLQVDLRIYPSGSNPEDMRRTVSRQPMMEWTLLLAAKHRWVLPKLWESAVNYLYVAKHPSVRPCLRQTVSSIRASLSRRRASNSKRLLSIRVTVSSRLTHRDV